MVLQTPECCLGPFNGKLCTRLCSNVAELDSECVWHPRPQIMTPLSLSVCFERQVEDDSRVFYLLILQHDDENTPDSKFLSNVFKPYRTKVAKTYYHVRMWRSFPFQ